MSFPQVDEATWKAAVEQELKGAPFASLVSVLAGGMRVEPLYTDRPALPATVRGDPSGRFAVTGWLGDSGSTEELRRWVADDVEGGCDALLVERELADDPRFPHVLGRLDLGRVALLTSLGASVAGATAFAAWLDAQDPRGDASPHLVGLDPIGAFARDGAPTPPQVPWRDVATLVDGRAGRSLLASTEPYHDAGADPAMELAYALGTTAELLRRLELPPERVASRLTWRFAVGREVLVEVAKLRAARLLWGRLFRACGLERPPPPHLLTTTSWRTLTRRDPWVNQLRATTQAFAAIVGGASAVAVRPYDAALGVPDALGRRLARNTLLVLRHESHLDAVSDPAGGSFAVEHLTDSLARAAWERFRGIERDGGMASRLSTGAVKDELRARWEERVTALRARTELITGVTEFPDPAERPLARSDRATMSAAAAGAPCPLPRHRDAAPFERVIRDADGHPAWEAL